MILVKVVRKTRMVMLLSDGDRLQQVELLVRAFRFPADGTYEDMYAQLENKVLDFMINLNKTVILGERLSSEELNGDE